MTRRSASVTIRDVAREAGVSVATVSRDNNKNAPISAEVSERLQEVLSRMRYVPHAAARNLASRKTRPILPREIPPFRFPPSADLTRDLYPIERAKAEVATADRVALLNEIDTEAGSTIPGLRT